jgi:hypothetical protein
MVADAWNDVRNDDALGSASRVPSCGESLTGVQIESPKWSTSLRTTRIELPIWTWMRTLSTVLLIKVVQHDRRTRRPRGRPWSAVTRVGRAW